MQDVPIPERKYYYRLQQLTRVIDGDTVDAIIDLGFDTLVSKRIRLAGINTPEKHGATRQIGEEATSHLKALTVEFTNLHVHSEKIGKFGRVLGRLFGQSTDGRWHDLNQQMIDDGFALPYHGGKRSDTDFLNPEFLKERTTA